MNVGESLWRVENMSLYPKRNVYLGERSLTKCMLSFHDKSHDYGCN